MIESSNSRLVNAKLVLRVRADTVLHQRPVLGTGLGLTIGLLVEEVCHNDYLHDDEDQSRDS